MNKKRFLAAMAIFCLIFSGCGNVGEVKTATKAREDTGGTTHSRTETAAETQKPETAPDVSSMGSVTSSAAPKVSESKLDSENTADSRKDDSKVKNTSVTTKAADDKKVTTAKNTAPKAETVDVSDDPDVAQAKAELDKLADELNRSSDDYNNANQKLAEVSRSKDEQGKAVNDLSAKLGSASANNEGYSADAFGFFEYVGANDALDILNNSPCSNYTERGNSGDATSLDNMKASFDFIRECNQIRRENGLSELLVSDKLMAMAQSDINVSDSIVGHSNQFACWENLSWNNVDPFQIWYYEEKPYNGGHYQNMMTPELVCTGFAVCTAGRSGTYGISHSQVFLSGAFDYGTAYTVDDYQARFDDFYNNHDSYKLSDGLQAAYNEAYAKYQELEKEQEACQQAADAALQKNQELAERYNLQTEEYNRLVNEKQ